MKKAKKEKQPKKKKTLRGFLAKLFLIFTILFFLLAISGITSGVISAFVFCAVCGLACLYVHRMLKKWDADREKEAAALAKTEEAAAAAEPKTQKTTASSIVSGFKILDDDTVDIVFPDGHIEQHRVHEKVDTACLITENGRTYHNKVGCFKNWSAEYRDTFTKWQIITLEDAEKRGLRRCRFCYAYELAKEDHKSILHTLSCAAQKYQDNLFLCKVGDKCSIEYDYDKERYNVFCGDEIGYLPAKFADDCGIDLECADVFVDEMTEQDNGKYTILLLIR